MRSWFSQLGRARFVAVLFVLTFVLIGSLGLRKSAARGYWDTDLRNIRNTESVRTDPRLGIAPWRIFGTWITPVVAVSRSAADRDRSSAALSQADRRHSALGRASRDDHALRTRGRGPARPHRQAARAADRVDNLPTEKSRRKPASSSMNGCPEGVPLITVPSVPEGLRSLYTEKSGATEHTTLVFPSLAIDFDDARNIVAFAARVYATPLPEGSVVGGAFLILAGSCASCKDALRLIGMVCLLVGGPGADLFPSPAAHSCRGVDGDRGGGGISAHDDGVWRAAEHAQLRGAADHDWRWCRLHRQPAGATDSLRVDAREATAHMGGAILLCSLTTIFGYFTLLLASSGALRSFGQAAVLGGSRP